jgi:hypothetical protein
VSDLVSNCPSSYSLEYLAQYLRDNGYHVVTRDRVEKLTISHAVSKLLRDHITEAEIESIVKRRMGQELGHEIIQGSGREAVLWSNRDEEFNQVVRAEVYLIKPKKDADASLHQREAEHTGAVQRDHEERQGTSVAQFEAGNRFLESFRAYQRAQGILPQR